MYSVAFLPVVVVRFQLKEATSKWLFADFVIKPRVKTFYFVRVKLTNIINSYVILEFFSWVSSFFKEIWSKPNLFQVGFMGIFCQNLFYRHLPFAASVDSQPHHAETPPS